MTRVLANNANKQGGKNACFESQKKLYLSSIWEYAAFMRGVYPIVSVASRFALASISAFIVDLATKRNGVAERFVEREREAGD